MSTNETGNSQQHGQSVALLETPNGVTVIPNNPKDGNGNATTTLNGHTANDNDISDVQRRRLTSDMEDDSFEYATDRESSVYNPTTIPLRSVMASAGGRNARKSSDSEKPPTQSDLLTKGNELGIPESRFSRWIPKDQREILEKQARLLANRVQTTKTTDGEQIVPKSKTGGVVATRGNITAAVPKSSVPTETEI